MRRSIHLVSGIKKLAPRAKSVIADMLDKNETERRDLPRLSVCKCLTRYVIIHQEKINPRVERVTVHIGHNQIVVDVL